MSVDTQNSQLAKSYATIGFTISIVIGLLIYLSKGWRMKKFIIKGEEIWAKTEREAYAKYIMVISQN